MLATIFCSFVFILALFVYSASETKGFQIMSAIGSVFAISFLVISLASGGSVKKFNNEDKLLRERHKIEILLEVDYCYDTIKDAVNYNKKVDNGNNYWCRFKLEDRSYLKIDIDSYIKGDKND